MPKNECCKLRSKYAVGNRNQARRWDYRLVSTHAVFWREICKICATASFLAWIFYQLVWRDCGDGLATGQPQGIEAETHLISTSQGSGPEDARKEGQIRSRSRRFLKYPG